MPNAHQSGFTLIELICVVIIVGVLAGSASSKMSDIHAGARVAKMQKLLGALKGSAIIAHSSQLVQGLSANTSVSISGSTVTMVNGYPTADANGILSMIGGGGDFSVSGGGTTAGSVLTITSDAAHASCSITYTASSASNAPPAYSASPARANCT